MFEDSLIESKSAPISPEKHWTTLGSITLQSTAAALLIALPLLHPEQFPVHIEPLHLLLPMPPKPIVQVKPVAASSTSSSSPMPTIPVTVNHPLFPSNPRSNPSDGPPTPIPIGQSIWSDRGIPGPLSAADHGPAVSALIPSAPPLKVKVSEGVSAGMLISPIRPVYPTIARAARVEGTVVVEAIISRTGTIESLRVLSGSEMLRRAALEAIQNARYQPFRLNGEPTEVQTTITVNFRLNA